MYRDNNIRDEMACRRYNRNASLAKLEMDRVVQQCGSGVADKWG
jgi:hypothetical protein